VSGNQRTGERILATLANAPMSDEGLMHELDINRRQLALAINHLRRDGRVEQDDRQLWYLIRPDAQPVPVVDNAVEATEPDPTVWVDKPDKRGLFERLAAPRPTLSIALGDQVLQVLIAAGRVTQDDIRLAAQLIGGRA
jgi:hypothetical protein